MKPIALTFLVFVLLLCGCGKATPTSLPSVTEIVPTAIAPTPTPPATEPASSPSPTEAPKFSLDTLGLSADQLKAMKAHSGLEASIIAEAGGKFSATVTVYNTEGQPTSSKIEVAPISMKEDLNLKEHNKYGDTPVMLAADGVTKLYWIQEEKAWFSLELSADINKPVFVPFDKREVATRVVIAEFNQPFSPEAIARWNAKSNQYGIGFETHKVNAVTNEWTKWAYLINRSISDPGLTTNNSPIQTLNTWFTSTIPDGTPFEYYFTRRLDPVDPRNPEQDEWKVMQNAIGTEISSNKQNRDLFAKELFDVKNNAPIWFSVPIVKVDPNFFANPNLPNILQIQQLSLNKLLGIPGNNFSQLNDPTLAKWNLKFDYKIADGWKSATQSSPAYLVFFDTNNPDYNSSWYPPEIQTLLIPTFLMLR